MLTTTSRAVTGATTRYQAPSRSGRSTAVFSRAQCASPSGLFGRPARDTKSRLDEVALNKAQSAPPGKRKCGFSIKPTRLPKGSATVATRMSPPTSWIGACRLAPAAVKCRTAASRSGTPQYATAPPAPGATPFVPRAGPRVRVGAAPVRARAARPRRDPLRVGIEPQLVPADIEAHVERLVEVWLRAKGLGVPRLGALQVGYVVDDRAQTEDAFRQGSTPRSAARRTHPHRSPPC